LDGFHERSKGLAMNELQLSIKELDYAISMHAQAMCKLEMMKQQNSLDKEHERPLTFQPYQFEEILDEFQLHHRHAS